MLETASTEAGRRGARTVRRRWALPPGLGEAIGLFLILRLSLGLLALTLTAMERVPGPCFQFGFDAWPDKPALVERGLAFQTLGVWERWDGCWYLRIATHGYGRYESGEPATAFFPAYPALTRLAGTLLGGRMLLGGLVVSGLAFIAAIAGLYRLVLRDFDRETARRACLYIAVFPTAFFFFAPFTEALFLAASVWAIYAARMRWWGIAAVAAFLAGLTRIQGAVLGLPLAWEAFRALQEARLPGDGFRTAARRAASIAPAVAAPVLAVALFFLYATREAGMSPLEAQRRNWGSAWYPPWTVVRSAWDWSFNRTDIPWRDLQAINAVNLFVLLGFIALLVLGARRLPLSYTLFAAPQLLLVASRLNPTPLTSTARYVLVLFPVFVILALLGKHRWLDQSWLILSLLFLGFFTAAFLRNTFIA